MTGILREDLRTFVIKSRCILHKMRCFWSNIVALSFNNVFRNLCLL